MAEFISTDSLFTPSAIITNAQGEVTRSFTHTLTVLLSASLSLPLSVLPLCYEKLTVIYAIMLTKYLLGRSGSGNSSS